MSDKEKFALLSVPPFFLAGAIFLVALVPFAYGAILASVATVLLWIYIGAVSCFSYKPAASGKALMDVRNNWKPIKSKLLLVSLYIALGSMVVFSILLGLMTGIMAPFVRSNSFSIADAKLIVGTTGFGYLMINLASTYLGLSK